MIGKLKGILSDIEGNVGLIETSGGVSYRVYLPKSLTSPTFPTTPIELYTHLQVKEDDLVLFGFTTKDDYNFFKLLISVSGVGPKTAYLIISNARLSELIVAIQQNNIDFFTAIKGLGKKTAMKIILELSQKLKSEFSFEKMSLSDEDKTVIEALVSLGFKSNDAKFVISKLPKNISIEQKIQEALKIIK
jgi:holliday junction DNA helicase RuvA